MANRSKRMLNAAPNLEQEIERNRELEEWDKVILLVEQLKKKSGDKSIDTLACFLTGEAKLETYLDEHPPIEQSVQEAKVGLLDAKNELIKATGDEAKKLGVHLDSFILLGKLHFAQGMYLEALDFYEKAQLESLEEKHLPTRSLKIIAEAYSIKALCMEKTPAASSSKAYRHEREESILRAYELAGDLTLLFLQQADKTVSGMQSTWSLAPAGTNAIPIQPSPLPSPDYKPKLGPILEVALHRAPTLYLKAGKFGKAILRYRAILTAEESDSTKEIRRHACCKLAELLLFGCSDDKYSKPDSDPAYKRLKAPSVGGSSSAIVADSPWKPKKNPALGNANLFVPKSKHEELILVLLLSEYISSKGAVLSQNAQLASLRKSRYEVATVTYDLLALTLARFFDFRILSNMLERAMKFSFYEKHTWQQFAYVLACGGNFYRSLQVFREMSAIHPDLDAGSCLTMARFCYERLSFYTEGLTWSKRALDSELALCKAWLRARCHVYIAVGYTLLVRSIESQRERQELLSKAESHLKEAKQWDTCDHLIEFHLAHHYAMARKINRANSHVRKALSLHPEHLPSLQLFILLLTASQKYSEALALTDQTLDQFPDNYLLMLFKVLLQETVHGSQEALTTAKDMLQQWHSAVDQKNGTDMSSGVSGGDMSFPTNGSFYVIGSTADGSSCQAGLSGTPINVLSTSATLSNALDGASSNLGYNTLKSSAQLFDAYSDKDSISLHAHSLSASHIERTLSEMASAMSAQTLHLSSSDPMYILMRIWLLTAEIHLRNRNIEEAEMCVNEAMSWSPFCYHVTFVRGLIKETMGEYEEARRCYENSLSVNPTHLFSLYHLARVYYHLEFFHLSEQTLRMALRIEPTAEDIWTRLGVVTEAIANELMANELAINLSTSSANSTPVDCNDRFGDEPALSHFCYKNEANVTPTSETRIRLHDEATAQFSNSAKYQAIALSMHATSPILPFSTIPLPLE